MGDPSPGSESSHERPATPVASSSVRGAAPELPTDHRRGFLTKAAAVVAGGALVACPLAAGVVVFVDPLCRAGDGARRVRITPLDALPADGVPRQFQVVVQHRDDAWNRFHNEPIGSVFLRRLENSDKVEALNASCPHAGCFVAYDSADKDYKCPCHNSVFNIEGLVLEGPPPRRLDTLKCEVVDVKGVKEVFVEFEDFYTGIADKIPKA